MKHLFATIACLLAITTLRAGEDEDRKQIVQRARSMVDATFKGDMTAVIQFMHPGAIKAIGGKEAVKKAIGGVAEQMKQLGLEFVSMDIQPPDKFLTNNGKTFTVVKTKTVMQITGKTKLTEESSMIAIRETADGPWTFLRVNAPVAQNRQMLKMLLPDVPDDLVIEAPVKPVAEPLSK
jgi:hypothetical protein